MGVEITDRAADRFKQLTTGDGRFPRIEITAGGCNGFDKKFSMDFPRENDLHVSLENGAVILIDDMTNEMLSDSKIDFKSDLAGDRFTIDIPDATSTCGCGSSFSL